MPASDLLQQLLAHAIWATATVHVLKRWGSLRRRALTNRWNARVAAWRAAAACRPAAPDGTHE